MTPRSALPRPASSLTKELSKMTKRLTFVAVLTVAVLSLFALPAAPATAAPSPWWQVLTGSRPTNLWEPEPSIQEIETDIAEEGELKAAAIGIEVNGEVIGCLGTDNEFGTIFCGFATGFPPSETAEQLEATLESAFGTTKVDVFGGPVGG